MDMGILPPAGYPGWHAYFDTVNNIDVTGYNYLELTATLVSGSSWSWAEHFRIHVWWSEYYGGNLNGVGWGTNVSRTMDISSINWLQDIDLFFYYCKIRVTSIRLYR